MYIAWLKFRGRKVLIPISDLNAIGGSMAKLLNSEKGKTRSDWSDGVI